MKIPGLAAFVLPIWLLLNDQSCFGFRPSLHAPRVRRGVLMADIKKNNGINFSKIGKDGHEGVGNTPLSDSHIGSKSGYEEHGVENAYTTSSSSPSHDNFNITYHDVSKVSRSPLDSVKKSVRSVPGLGLGHSQRSLSESTSTPINESGGGSNSVIPKTIASKSVNAKSSDPIVSQIHETRAMIEDLKRQVRAMEGLLSGNSSKDASVSSRAVALEKEEKASSELDAFMTSLKMQKIPLNKENVQRCATFACFVMGCAVMASVYHRLWLLGGILAAWWSGDAVHSDNRVGQLVRRVGVYMTQFIRDRQEQWNYVVIYYETGRLAYASRKKWEKFDKRFSIDERFTAFKKRAMKRASQLNSEEGVRATLNDLWESTQEVRANVKKLDKKYGLSRNVRDFSRGLYLITNQSVGSWLEEVRMVGSSVSGSAVPPAKKTPRYSGSLVNPWFPTWLLGPQSQYNPAYRRNRLRKATGRDRAMSRDKDRLRELQRLKRERREQELERQRMRSLERDLYYTGVTPPGSGGFLRGVKEFFGQEQVR
jgi:hypothetical protein